MNRRSFLGSLAALGAGAAALVLAPRLPSEAPPPEPPAPASPAAPPQTIPWRESPTLRAEWEAFIRETMRPVALDDSYLSSPSIWAASYGDGVHSHSFYAIEPSPHAHSYAEGLSNHTHTLGPLVLDGASIGPRPLTWAPLSLGKGG